MENPQSPIHRRKGRRKTFIFSAMAVILIVAAVSITVLKSHNNATIHTAAHAVVKSTCAATLYPDLCISTITEAAALSSSSSASAVTTPKDVLLTALNYTIYTVQRNYFTVKKIGASRSLTARETTALHDCLEMIDDTLAELLESSAELKDYGFQNYTLADHTEKLTTLLSAAQTNQESCLDGFSHDAADRKVREGLIAGQMHVFKLASNVLAIIKNLTVTEAAELGLEHSSAPPSGRRMGEEWPEWLSAGERRLLQSGNVVPDVTVAADGSGDYRTVSEAVAAAPERRTAATRYVIRVKAGVYRENVDIPRRKTYLMFVGDGRMTTIITARKNVMENSTTFNSATVAVVGTGFLARDITFQNTAGPSKHQAVALRVNADLSAFYRCNMLAYQDTLYVHSLRQFYSDCIIAGTVDFIFGNANVVIQNSNIQARRPNPGQRNMVTAQARDDPNQNTGIIIQNCRIGATSDLLQVPGQFRTYLGRPWRMYSRTVIMQTEITGVIDPAGWFEWDGDFALSTLYYAEFRNTGAGSDTSNRVTWAGVRRSISQADAEMFTAGRFIAGGNWLPVTGFRYSLGL